MDPNAQYEAPTEDLQDTQEYVEEEGAQFSGQPDAQEDFDTDIEETAEVTEATEEAEENSEQEPVYSKLSDFAEALEMDYDDLLQNIKTTVKVNGKEIPVTLKDLHSGYQMEADYRRKTAEAAENRRQFDEMVSNVAQRYQERVDELEALSTLMEESLMSDWENVDWQTLRSEDPANYAAVQHDMNQRKSQVEQAKMKVHMLKQQQQQEFQQKLQREIIPMHMNRLQTEVNTDWKDQSKWISDYRDILGTIQEYGFSADEAKQVFDSRALHMAWDALKYKRLKSSRKEGVEKIKQEAAQAKRKLPNVIKPGTKQKQQTSTQQRQIDNLRKKVKSTGELEDVAALLAARRSKR